MKIILSMVLISLLTSCVSSTVAPPEVTTTTTTLPQPEKLVFTEPLSWEAGKPERILWSAFVFGKIDDLFGRFDKARDITEFCSNYHSMTRAQKINVWGEIISATAYRESSWNPNSNSVDVGTAANKDTHSIGLMQMSVVDQKNYASLFGKEFLMGYDYKTLIQPIPNLDLALQVMSHQIMRLGYLMHTAPNSKGLYWAVLYKGGKFDRTKEIKAHVKKQMVKICK